MKSRIGAARPSSRPTAPRRRSSGPRGERRGRPSSTSDHRAAARRASAPGPGAPRLLRVPGGAWAWTLGVVSAAAALGVAAPATPPGQALGAVLGSGGVLVLGWCAWLGWLRWQARPVPLVRATTLAVLSAAWLLVLDLHHAGGGGSAGRVLMGVLVDWFGRTGGLVLAFLFASAALAALVGPARLRDALAVIGLHGRRLLVRPEDRVRRRRPASPPSGAPLPAVAPLASRDLDDDRDEIVILGPRGAEAEPAARSATPSPEPRPALDHPAWVRPDPSVLERSSDAAAFSPADLKARAHTIEETLLSFNVQARVVEVQQGPAITQFGLDPAPGVAVSRIVSRQNDLALRLGAPSLRVLAPVPGRPLVGLEVPNASVATVKLGDLVGASAFGRARLPLGIGMDVAGKPVIADLTRMPHLLIAGATGSGKSVAINSLIASLLLARTPDEVQLILIDPKQVEMSQYKGLPHLRLPVVTDMDKVVATLRWTVLEMERRYTRFSEVGARNIVAFNERFPNERLGYLVVVVDELADMMMTAAEDVERLICRLAQLGRAAGVHLVVATQRPSVDVLTGLIKANLPTRLAFAVSSQTDSRVILDRAGAERLLGRGDGLYQAGDEMNPRRVQGAFSSDEEIESLCSHWRAQGSERHTLEDEEELERLARANDPEEKLLRQAREILAEQGDVTVGYLQRRLRIGREKAQRIHQTLIVDEAAARAGGGLAED